MLLWQISQISLKSILTLATKPNHHFIKTAEDENLPTEFKPMYCIFNVMQNPVKV